MTFERLATILSLGIAIYFGLRSLFQAQDLENLQTALRAYHQTIFNDLWRIGEDSERSLKASSLPESREFTKAVAEISQTSRHAVIAFSREHSQFQPTRVPAWEPTAIEKPGRRFIRRFFRI